MKTINGLILGLFVTINAYAIDCKQLSVQLIDLPLKPKIVKLDGYRATSRGFGGNNSMASFWRQTGNIQESIKMHYQSDSAFMLTATYRGYTETEASSKLNDMISIVGKSNVSRRDGNSSPYYYVECNEGMSAALFINELHVKKPVSYIVNLFVVNESMYKSIYGKSSPVIKNF
jgi:hypothetical protein